MKTSALNLSVIVSLLVCSLAHGYTLRKGQDGKVLIWDADRVEIYIDKSSLPKVGGAVDAVRAGFDVWSSSGMPIEFEYEISEKPLSRDGRDGKTVVVFENNKWGHGEDVVAITLTTYR
ncbi:MAG: hypothetical protein KDA51_20065, partial [Planctomycetales bacterium]|nr:hypothetical protein [Planctomycetales bacterium]